MSQTETQPPETAPKQPAQRGSLLITYNTRLDTFARINVELDLTRRFARLNILEMQPSRRAIIKPTRETVENAFDAMLSEDQIRRLPALFGEPPTAGLARRDIFSYAAVIFHAIQAAAPQGQVWQLSAISPA